MKESGAESAVVVGAGVGGLAAALRLAHEGFDVTVVDRADGPGGKMRTIASEAGPVDAGPTVLTLRSVLDDLFRKVGENINDHVALAAEQVIARHWWPDGSRLDLFADAARNADAIGSFAGSKAVQEYTAFCGRTKRLFAAFRDPVMFNESPSLAGVVGKSLGNPRLVADLAPHRTLWQTLCGTFSDPRLRQLFGRYATYVGGSPFSAPTVLGLIWEAEAQGVWRVEGGMHRLARALETLARRRGATFVYQTEVHEIEVAGHRVTGVRLSNGNRLSADRVVFNGDPAAIAGGLLGRAITGAVPQPRVTPRSLSAYVWAFAARACGADLAHHNVFFNSTYQTEFDDIAAGRMPSEATLYVCAQDRGTGTAAGSSGIERFEIIMNGAPVRKDHKQEPEDFESCRIRTFDTLSQMGLEFDHLPPRTALTTPSDFAHLFPASAGSLYGLSPHGMMATFRRPVPRTKIRNLYLAGGGVHPGAGVPMALLSGQHAAEAIVTDRVSTSTSPRTATPGGMSTDFPMTAKGASR